MNDIANPLFRGVSDAEWKEMEEMNCLWETEYRKNKRICQMGNVIHELGVVTKGRVHIETVDPWGNKSILSEVGEGEVFAETYAFCEEPMMVEVSAAEDTNVLWLDVRWILINTGSGWQEKIQKNMLQISLRKNLILSQRIFCTTPKTIRERVLTYLTAQSLKADGEIFEIPFNRQQMAEYLNLDRSALSKELGKMKQEGILDFHKNMFRILKKGSVE